MSLKREARRAANSPGFRPDPIGSAASTLFGGRVLGGEGYRRGGGRLPFSVDGRWWMVMDARALSLFSRHHGHEHHGHEHHGHEHYGLFVEKGVFVSWGGGAAHRVA